ncbi:MAG: hypothetical protein ACD_78C00346G0005 [uncultured bacterium (gcode 4)]|uniref:Uncharacterized protein n=1 Tax=uncultured bacterium (gcode 4) TaxID=1234023 RepID=K1XWH9_9BACT|nr:MAG: hypothetical protein ACD_78C00346G0005 [uncultured bacterium (gcode 4)]HBB27335.1 hypothetical protein [Candidatus Gracilibacteria bacterium]
MKLILSLLLFFLSFGSVFAADETAPVADLMSYEGYKNNVEKYCKLDKTVPNRNQLWVDWEKESLIKKEQVIYADITKKEEGDREYKRHLGDIKADPSKIDTIEKFSLGPAFLEKASYTYKETMGAIYACAVMNAKVRIIGTLMTKIPMTQSNTKERYQKQLDYIRKAAGEKCRITGDTSELSIKKTLLDNTTYQYCNYRQYLHYLDSVSKKSLDVYYKISKEGTTTENINLLKNTDSAAMEISRSAGKITSEISHTREVFPQAMVAFTEFEKTYASHIILEFILQDYLDLRETLKQLLNPIGQVIYKASNAQSPGK